MCGIAGVASSAPVETRGWLSAARDAQRHRGPDGEGEWWSDDSRVGLAHVRLAIVDLSPAGQQPMVDRQTGSVISFNGEIYNFREIREELSALGATFRSHSDTEVILMAYHFWGMAFLSRLDGMFAMAIYDAQARKLILARDRAGEKPLFYRLAGTELRFASELKGLLVDPAMPRRIDPEALDCYLSFGYVPGEHCMLSGYAKLPPGHLLVFDIEAGQVEKRIYWQPPRSTHAQSSSDTALVDELESLLEASVARQLLADVPVGVLLSGGLDSSLITALAARHADNVKTFTVRFVGHDKFDETEYARLIARKFGTTHIELDAEEGTADLLPRLARQIDEPMADSSCIPTYLVSAMVRQHCTVALGGDGGDELFGGYGYYPKLLALRDRTRLIPRFIGAPMGSLAAAALPPGFSGSNVRAWLKAVGTDWNRDLPLIGSFHDRAARRRLVSAKAASRSVPLPLVAERIWQAATPSSPDVIDRATRMDFANYLLEDILVKVDRMSMLNSLELRAPMLDRRIIEFAMGTVPTRLKTSRTERKILLKRLGQRILPQEFALDRKQGFSIPLDRWLTQGPFLALFRDVLLDDAATFDRPYVASLLEGQAKGRSNGERLFALVMFELWRRQYGAHF